MLVEDINDSKIESELVSMDQKSSAIDLNNELMQLGSFSRNQQFNSGGPHEIESLSLNNSQIRFYDESSPMKSSEKKSQFGSFKKEIKSQNELM